MGWLVGNAEAYWEATLEDTARDPTIHPIDRIVGLLRSRGPMTARELADASGYPPGNVGLYIIRARARGTRIIAQFVDGRTVYHLEETADVPAD